MKKKWLNVEAIKQSRLGKPCFTWFARCPFMLGSLLFPAMVQAGLPKVKIDGINTDNDDIFAVLKEIVYATAEFAIYIIGIIAVIIPVLIVLKEAREARNQDDGRWGRVLTAFVGGILMIVVVMFMLNYALEIIPT